MSIATTIISEKDDGIYHAINKGIRVSQGNIIKIFGRTVTLTF